MSSQRKRFDRAFWVALALFFATTTALQWASRRQGFTRDEGYYFHAAELHAAYYEELFSRLASGDGKALVDRKLVDRFFSYNYEHPPLLKTLFGLSWRFLHRCNCPKELGLHAVPWSKPHRTLGLLSNGGAMRLPSHLLAGALVAAVFLLGLRLFGWAGAISASVLAILTPRHVFHASLSCFDAPVTAMLCLTTWAYVRAQQTRSLRFALLSGVLFGLALATKHNAFFLPPLLVLHALWLRRDVLAEAGPRFSRFLRYVFQPWALAMATIGPAVYLLVWPYLWFDPVGRFKTYVSFHLHHVHYNIEYLGQNFNRPPFPWHYVPVMTAATMPVTTLLLAIGGLFAWLFAARRVEIPPPADEHRAGERWLVLLSALVPMLVIMRPGTPIFGAEKHWLPAVPFLALLAGAGVACLVRSLFPATTARRLWASTVVILALAPSAASVAVSHPYGLSHYNALFSGPVGAANAGMNRQFWGYAVSGAMPFLNRALAPHTPIYFHDANGFMLQMSQLDGLLRRDLPDSGHDEAGIRASAAALVLHEKHFNKYEFWIWDAYGTTKPSFVLTHLGVPLCTVYQRPPR